MGNANKTSFIKRGRATSVNEKSRVQRTSKLAGDHYQAYLIQVIKPRKQYPIQGLWGLPRINDYVTLEISGAQQLDQI